MFSFPGAADVDKLCSEEQIERTYCTPVAWRVKGQGVFGAA